MDGLSRLASKLWHAPAFFWLLLCIPGVPMALDLATGVHYRGVIHESGEWAIRFTIFALMLTPLQMLFRRSATMRWLVRRRRYIGLAAFGYAALHAIVYVADTGALNACGAPLVRLGIWVGWVSFLLYLPLAATSNDTSVRTLGTRWKLLQRLVYPALGLAAAHWYLVDGLSALIVHCLPLALLETYRVLYAYLRPRRLTAAG